MDRKQFIKRFFGLGIMAISAPFIALKAEEKKTNTVEIIGKLRGKDIFFSNNPSDDDIQLLESKKWTKEVARYFNIPPQHLK